jgi:hypothetical protein
MNDKRIVVHMDVHVDREHLGTCGRQCQFHVGGFPYFTCAAFRRPLQVVSRGKLRTLTVRCDDCLDLDRASPYSEDADDELAAERLTWGR